MNKLEEYFFDNNKKLIHKYHHYFNIYDKHFSQFIGKEINILEIGIFQGGSLQMWKNYFGPLCKVHGIDIDPRCKQFEEEGISIYIGSQEDKAFLNQLVKNLPPLDIIIDDGGHYMRQQIVSFETLFPHLKDGGVYLCEDCHTSYWPNYGGGYKRRGTFIEYSKSLIDSVNAYHSKSSSLKVNFHTQSVAGIHFYDSIVVFEKSRISHPVVSKTGIETFSQEITPTTKNKLLSYFRTITNKVSHFFNLPYYIH